MAALALAVVWVSLSIGSAHVPVMRGLIEWCQGLSTPAAMVIGDIRLPRTLLAVLVGAALGLAGAALQGLLRNPLADPSLTGASQGAALGAAAVFYFGLWPAAGELAPALAGLMGAALTLTLMLLLAGAAWPATVIMAGLAVSTLSGAALAVVLNFAPNPYAMQELVFWLLGSVADRSLRHVVLMGGALAVGAVLILGQKRLLWALSLGELGAESLGLSPRRGTRIVVLGTAVLVGAAVSIAGSIGFVGLLVPHLVRPLVRHRPDLLLWPSAWLGGTLVCLADIGVRLLPPGQELKLGVLTSLLGAPMFIWLVWKDRKRWI